MVVLDIHRHYSSTYYFFYYNNKSFYINNTKVSGNVELTWDQINKYYYLIRVRKEKKC